MANGPIRSILKVGLRFRPLMQSKMAEFSSPGTPSGRHEKSLGLLTTKFVNLLQEAKDGVLDLKMVSFV